jgi:photosystem II stability/assembly factor-like uncharacterized protein
VAAKASARKRPAGRKSAAAAASQRRRLGWLAWILVGVLVAAGAFWVAKEQATGGGEAIDPPPIGLPHTPDYHSLLVDSKNPRRLLLGTHVGLYESTDGGRSWRFAGLEGKDVINLARSKDGTVWAAGHNVFERSDDDGRAWTPVRPDGLPGLDIHGFAASYDVGGRLEAAINGKGLYRSDDGGETFSLLSDDVGASVVALAETKDGVLLASDTRRGLLANMSGDGREWVKVLDPPVAGVATPPVDPNATADLSFLATSHGIVRLTRGPEAASRVVRPIEDGAGPVVYAPSDPSVAYAVGNDRKLYRSLDGGESWKVVS